MQPKTIVRREPPGLSFSEALSEVDHLLHRIFATRKAIYNPKNHYPLALLHPPSSMKGLDAAVDLLQASLQAKEKIVIVGDFDADGATSTAVLVRCLKACGHQLLEFIVPNRFEFGYGLTPEIVELSLQYKPKLIVTVDNGISSIEGVAAARNTGIKVLITDHHLPGSQTPDANAIVNPNQHGCEFPSKNLAGVGVIFYVMLALRARLRDINWFQENGIEEPNFAKYLDLVALGTVADVVPLDNNNRVLVAQGVQRIRAGICCPGIEALFKISGRESQRASAGDFGFSLGPRLNAAGRLDDMSLGIRCLLSDDISEALAIAQELEDLNRERKSIEASMKVEAVKALESLDSLDEHKRSEGSKIASGVNGLCLYREDWHQGVVGILASRVKDRMHRPAIVFSKTDDVNLKGSGRSIPGIHMRDVLDEIASANPGLIEKFGGHAMAAGLSINAERYQQFAEQFDLVVGKYLDEEMKSPVLFSDGELTPAQINLELAKSIQAAGPWGQAFPEPLFDGVFRIIQQKIVGTNHLKLMLAPGEFNEAVVDAIAFNIDTKIWPNNEARNIKIAYRLDVNHFRGRESVQLRVEYLEAL